MSDTPVQWRWSRLQRVVLRGGAVVALLATILAQLDAANSARGRRGATVLGVTLLCVWAWRSAACRVTADAHGIHEVRRFGRRHVPWSELESVRMGSFRHRLIARTQSITLAADADGERIVDAALRQAPRLSLLGYGLGLRTDPPLDELQLPDAVHADEHALRIDGPGENQLVFSTRRADYTQLLTHARNRLVAAILHAHGGAADSSAAPGASTG